MRRLKPQQAGNVESNCESLNVSTPAAVAIFVESSIHRTADVILAGEYFLTTTISDVNRFCNPVVSWHYGSGSAGHNTYKRNATSKHKPL